MTKEELVKEIDDLIEQSVVIKGSFVYHYCLDDVKRRNGEAKYNEIKESYEIFKDTQFATIYQKWYSKSLAIINIIMPERKAEFEALYLPKSNRKELTLLNYTIFDAIRGIRNRSNNVSIESAYPLILTQIEILKSIKDLVAHRLNEIMNLLEFDIFEKEIDAARYLLKNKYLRSAGAVCGVILEKHLTNMLKAAGLPLTKKNPSINDLNSDLYQNKVIDQTQYKFILFLGDIRNKCDHNKSEEPKKEEVEDLIAGTEKVIKTY